MPAHRTSARRRTGLLIPGVLGALLAGALAFAILAAGGSPGTHPASTSAVAVTSSGRQSEARRFAGATLPGDVAAPGFSLTDQYGRQVSLSSFRGRPVLLAFLYAHCGAPCVVIGQQIRGALNELAHPVPVLIVSVDPAGDTPAAVRRFLASVSLSGRVEYLTGPARALAAIWRAYRVTPAAAGPVAFAGAASVLLIDGGGHERVLYGTEELTPESLSHDIAKLGSGNGGP